MLTQHHIAFFVALPMAAGVLTLLLSKWRNVQRGIGVVALGLNVMLGVWALSQVYHGPGQPTAVMTSQMGNWPAPFGITIAVDALSAVMLLTGSVVVLAVYLFCLFTLGRRYESAKFHPLYHFLVFGVQWSFVTGDLFNLFVAFEIMLMASYAMFVIGTSRPQLRQAYKYVLLNLLGSTMFVTCAGLIYGHVGTLNMADLTRICMTGQLPAKAVPVVVMLLIVFGGKAAIFPLWYWLPDTYHTLPPAIGGLFAGLLTKVGAYVLIRVFVMIFGGDPRVAELLAPIVLVSAAVTMFVGVLGAVSMHSVRRILSIHIISQVGYMILGVGLYLAMRHHWVGLVDLAGAPIHKASMPIPDSGKGALLLAAAELAVAGAIFFILHNMVVKCCLFLCGGLMQRHAGSDDLDSIGGLVRTAPVLATLFLIAAMSLAGLPPTSGFFGKWALIKASFDAGVFNSLAWWVVAFAIATSLLTLLSMLKIWSYGFWSEARGAHTRHPVREARTAGGLAAIAVLVAAAAAMGLGSQFVLDACRAAARSAIDPTNYVTTILGPHALSPRAEHAENQRHPGGSHASIAQESPTHSPPPRTPRG